MKHEKCMECGKPLSGRTDKKFCCGKCRNRFNNRRYGYSGKKEAATRAENRKRAGAEGREQPPLSGAGQE